MTTGVISTIPFEDYLKDPAVSASMIKVMLKSGPEAYYKTLIDPSRRVTPPTSAMLFGSFFHTAILEPEELPNRYMPCGPRNTKSGKEESLYIKSRGLIPVSHSDWNLMEEMVEAVRSHPLASSYLDDTKAGPEQSFWWDDPTSGLCCKARADLVVGDTIVDLKTTQLGNATDKAFAKTVLNFGYHIQAAHYLRGTKKTRFIFLVVEKAWPFSVGLFELDEQAIALGNEEIDKALELISLCHQNDSWPGQAEENSTISLPNWAFYK